MAIDLFSIGKFTVHGYGLMIGLGFLAAVLVGCHLAKRRGLSDSDFTNIAMLVLVFGFAGGKILHMIVEFRTLLTDPMAVIGSEGFVVYGGIISGIATIFIYCRIKKLEFLKYIDLFAASVPLNQAFGRIGCLLAGCCYGAVTDSPIGVVFPSGSLAPAGVKLWPTQLMMSAGNFIIAGILILASTKLKKRGQIGSLYLILYAIGRFGIEFLRNDHRGAVGVFSTSQFISLFIVVIGIGLFIWRTMSNDEAKPGTVEEYAASKRDKGKTD